MTNTFQHMILEELYTLVMPSWNAECHIKPWKMTFFPLHFRKQVYSEIIELKSFFATFYGLNK